MSAFLSPPPQQSPIAGPDMANRQWLEFFKSLHDFARKYRGSGATAERPTNALNAGDWFFDTTLGMPISWTGAVWWAPLVSAAASANSTVSVTSADAATTSGTATAAGYGFGSPSEFNAAITSINTIKTLANELKADVNQLVTDTNDLKTKLRAAGIIAT